MRSKAYEDGTNISLFLPRALVEEIAGMDVPGAYSKSRNAKIVALLEMAVAGHRKQNKPTCKDVTQKHNTAEM